LPISAIQKPPLPRTISGRQAWSLLTATFEILAEQKIIADEFLSTARQMVQFRNRIVHLYWEVEAEVIYDILQKNLEGFETFTSQILKYLSAHQ